MKLVPKFGIGGVMKALIKLGEVAKEVNGVKYYKQADGSLKTAKEIVAASKAGQVLPAVKLVPRATKKATVPEEVTNINIPLRWQEVKSSGRWDNLPKFQSGYRGTTTYQGGWGAQQGSLYLPNNGRVGGGPSNAKDIENLIMKDLQHDITRGMYFSDYQVGKTIQQRLNNLYRLSDADLNAIRSETGPNLELFNSRLMQLIKGYNGRTKQGTR